MRLGFSQSAFSLCLFLCVVPNSHAATPRDELLRLVPDDSGLCILVQNLRESAERLQQSPFAQALAASPVAQAWRNAPETQQLAAIDQRLRAQLNISAVQLRDDILGDAVVLAVAPGPPGKPELDQALLLVSARNPQRLRTLIDRLNEVQQKAGEIVELETRELSGEKYVVRKKKAGEEFYWLRGSLFAFSDSEARIRKAIECHGSRPPADDVPSLELQRLRDLGAEQNLFTLWVNPRKFDAAVEQKQSAAQGDEAKAIQQFAAVWQALDAAAIGVRLDRDASIAVAMLARPTAAPSALRALKEFGQPTKLWSAFPSNALVVAAGRSPWALADVSTKPDPRKAWQELFDQGVGALLGRQFLSDILRQVGPEFGFCIAPPDAGGSAWLPTVTAAMQWRSPVDTGWLSKFDAFLQLVVTGINAQHAARWQMRTDSIDQVAVRTLANESLLPAGFQPSIAWKNGYLVLASSPEAIRRFNPADTIATEFKDGETPIARLALSGWASYLRTHREPLAKFAATSHQLQVEVVQQRLDRLLETLDLFDDVVMLHRTDANRSTMTLRLRTGKPMMKP